MDNYLIKGGNSLSGKIVAQVSKNATLPILAASLLCDEVAEIVSVPDITDVRCMIKLLESLGVDIVRKDESVLIDASRSYFSSVSASLSKELRSSIFLLGSILGRFGRAEVSYPGGCEIGLRPIDLHIKGLRTMGVEIEECAGRISCVADNVRDAEIQLDFPSVGATENIILASCKKGGVTVVIGNAAKEPEIEDLQNFINAMGGCVSGAGSSSVTVKGVNYFHGVRYKPIFDRIAVGTYLIATAVCGGEIEISGVSGEHFSALINKLRETTCKVALFDDKIYLQSTGRLLAVEKTETGAFPAFPTDLQAPFMTLLSLASGTSVIIENIFETRFKHIPELVRMGARITASGRVAVTLGVDRLIGAEVTAYDLRGGAALAIAGLAAKGDTVLRDIRHIERGYDNFVGALTSLGARIEKIG